MNQDIESIIKKTVKIAGVTCVAAGAVALVTSAAAVKALAEGGRYLKDTVRKIIDEEPATADDSVVEAAEESAAEPVAEQTPEETTVEEEDFAEAEPPQN